MAALRQAGAPWPGAVAVSGGGDSLALMVLLAEWARDRHLALPLVLTVDHGLRAGSGRDARTVEAMAQRLGLEAMCLKWSGRKPAADLEAAARRARYRLMGTACRRHRLGALYLAHSREDQAETFLLRLARGSGLDGLVAMQALAPFPLPGFEDVAVVRPLLGVARAELRAFLEVRGINWAEDPMNADPRFARVRVRAAWPALEAAGLSAARIADATAHLARARAALEAVTGEFLGLHAHFAEDRVLLDGTALAAAPREIGLRVLAAVLGRVSGAAYRPRFVRLDRLLDAIAANQLGKGRTLHGCRIGPAPKRLARFGRSTLVVQREPGRRPRGREADPGRENAAKGLDSGTDTTDMEN